MNGVNKQGPREKARLFGIESLSDQELLAILIRTGYKGCSALDIAAEILNDYSLIDLPKMDLSKILEFKGIKEAKALELLTCFELTKRIAYQEIQDKDIVESPTGLIEWLKQEIGHYQQEHFLVVFLNTKNHIISYRVIFKGTLDTSIVHPREIFKLAVQLSASRLICVHNHPSSDITPSSKDIEITKLLCMAGDTMGIPLLDHIIIGQNDYYSFRANQLID